MRIAIFGTGGAGAYFGAHLARAGEDVVFIARGSHLEAIKADGLRVETPAGEIVVRPAQATDDPAQAGVVDAVVLGVKTWQVTEAAEAMRPMMGPETFVTPLQNGVEAASQLAAVLGPEHVLNGLCGTISQVVAPGRIRSIGDFHFVKFAERDKRPSARTERFRQVFERAGVKAEVPADIDVALWEKFLFVVSFGGVGSVTRAPIGVIRTLPRRPACSMSAWRRSSSGARPQGSALRREHRAREGIPRFPACRRDYVAAKGHRRRQALGAGGMERRGRAPGQGGRRRDTAPRVHLPQPAAP